jgi:hypothetical protein
LIPDLPVDLVETRLIQATPLFVMVFSIVPFGLGINRLVK